MKTLLALIILAAAVIGCTAAATPTPAPPPTATVTPAPITAPAPDSGICYRSPEIQQWIIRQLQIQSCRFITDPELYRITESLIAPQEHNGNGIVSLLRPGDLQGLANVKGISITDHCRDWTDPEFVSDMLAGFNPAGSVEIIAALNLGDYAEPTPSYTAKQRADAIRKDSNQRAHAIAAAVSATRDTSLPLFDNPSDGVVQTNLEQPGAVSVKVDMRQEISIPDCGAQGDSR